MSDTMLEPLTSCHVCGVKTCYSRYGFNTEPKERWFCEEHNEQQRDDPDLDEYSKRRVKMFREMDEFRSAVNSDALADVLGALSRKGTT
jgi:hypothetical protein